MYFPGNSITQKILWLWYMNRLEKRAQIIHNVSDVQNLGPIGSAVLTFIWYKQANRHPDPENLGLLFLILHNICIFVPHPNYVQYVQYVRSITMNADMLTDVNWGVPESRRFRRGLKEKSNISESEIWSGLFILNSSISLPRKHRFISRTGLPTKDDPVKTIWNS